jgi:hypothetical protein
MKIIAEKKKRKFTVESFYFRDINSIFIFLNVICTDIAPSTRIIGIYIQN